MDLTSLGRWMIAAGAVLALLGGAVWLAGKVGLPLGSLPGDINVQRENVSFHFPVVTCILFSIALTVVLNLVAKFWK